MSGAFLGHGIAYLELAPTYECSFDNGVSYTACVPSEFCNNPEVLFRIDDNVYSLNNWYT